MRNKFYETASRSFVKATTFRILVVLSDIVVVYILTQKYTIVASVVIFTNVASVILYVLHERTWNRIRWGKKVKK